MHRPREVKDLPWNMGFNQCMLSPSVVEGVTSEPKGHACALVAMISRSQQMGLTFCDQMPNPQAMAIILLCLGNVQ